MAKIRSKAKRKGSEWVAFALVLLVAAGILLAVVNYAPVKEAAPSGEAYFAPSDELREQNVLEVDGNTVTIGRGCTAIVSETSPERAEAIQMGLENKTGERPTSYDGWASMLGEFNVTLEAVTLYGKTDSAYLSRAIFRIDNRVLDLDMRPSDAMALALRTGAPIYLNMTLLREVGTDIC
jgi:hypothetical protein